MTTVNEINFKEIFDELLPVSSLTFKQIKVFFLFQGSEGPFTQSIYVKCYLDYLKIKVVKYRID